MSELSHPTLAVLVKAGQNLRESDLKTMLQAADIWVYSPYKTGCSEREQGRAHPVPAPWRASRRGGW